MRHLLDTYIQAKPSEVVADFEDTGLIQLIVRLGAGAIDKLPEGIKADPEAVAETITNNMRKVIIDERPSIRSTTTGCPSCSTHLDRAAAQGARRLQAVPGQAARAGPASSARSESDTAYPTGPTTAPSGRSSTSASRTRTWPSRSTSAVRHTKPDSWVGNPMKERKVKRAIKAVLPADFDRLDELMELVKARNEYR